MASINTDMPRISRKGDRCATGHKCTASAPVRSSQFTVFANGRPLLRKGDKLKPHTILVPMVPKPKCLVHRASVRGSSRKVFAEGKKVVRKGDAGDKGKMVGASFNVFAG